MSWTSARVSARSSLSPSEAATSRAICTTSMVCVKRLRKWSDALLVNTWVLPARRRNARAWTMRSRSRWNGVREARRGAGYTRVNKCWSTASVTAQQCKLEGVILLSVAELPYSKLNRTRWIYGCFVSFPGAPLNFASLTRAFSSLCCTFATSTGSASAGSE
jgi:hypothetical protein